MEKRHLFFISCALVLWGVWARLMPHVPNATPVTAIAITGSIYLGKRWAVILPTLVLALSDLVIGFYDWRIMLSVYGSFVIIGCVSWLTRTRNTPVPVGFNVLASSVLFFLVTNGAVWAFSPWYEKSFSGLLYAYELGVPFMRNMFVGDIIYTIALVAVFECAFAISALPRLSVRAA